MGSSLKNHTFPMLSLMSADGKMYPIAVALHYFAIKSRNPISSFAGNK